MNARHLLASVALASGALLAVPANADATLAADALVAKASHYDNRSVTVSGNVGSVQKRQTPRGTVEIYKLCSATCVTVVDATNPDLSAGGRRTATGTFHASFTTRTGATIDDAVLVGL